MKRLLTALWDGIKRSLTNYPPHTIYGIANVYKYTHWNQGQHDHEGDHHVRDQ